MNMNFRMLRVVVLAVLMVLMMLMMLVSVSCRTSNEGPEPPKGKDVATPEINSIQPASIYSDSPEFSLVVHGEGFIDGSKIIINNIYRDTRFWDENKLVCAVTPQMLGRAAALNQVVDYYGGENGKTVIRSSSVLSVSVASPTGRQMIYSEKTDVPITGPSGMTLSHPVKLMSAEPHEWGLSDIKCDDRGNVFVIANDMFYRNGQGGGNVYLFRSVDYGDSWEEPVRISDSEIYSEYPDLSLDGSGNLAVTWIETNDPNDGEKYLHISRSPDNGATWEAPRRILEDVVKGNNPVILMEDANTLNLMYLVYDELGMHSVTFGRSVDGGQTWSRVIIDNGDYADYFSLAKDDAGVLHAVYASNDGVNYCKSNDNGAIWVSHFISDERSFFGGPLYPEVVLGNEGDIFAAWNYDYLHRVGGSRQDELISRSVDGGITWTTHVVEDIVYPTGGGKVAWELDHDGDLVGVMNYQQLFIIRSKDSGQTWEPPLFFGPHQYSWYPGMAVDNRGNLFVSWKSNEDIYFRRCGKRSDTAR